MELRYVNVIYERQRARRAASTAPPDASARYAKRRDMPQRRALLPVE